MSTWAGNLIKLARLQRGLTQRQLAARAGTSQAAIAAYEAGRRSPTVETLARIIRSAGFDLRMGLAELDDHDEWLARYQESLPREALDEVRRLDAALLDNGRAMR
ncbi:MAG TPA: helix-turn-helix transcriptional regulator [Actinomycetota bacterium]|nr:helix-turn-helix transcriptional regulator [Actinomycetota bacterium]